MIYNSPLKVMAAARLDSAINNIQFYCPNIYNLQNKALTK